MNNANAVKYQPLSQIAPSDDEDEGFHDNILYDSRLVSGPNMDHRNIFELERLGQPRVRQPHSLKHLSRRLQICLLVTVLLVILMTAMVAVLFPILNHTYNHGIVTDIYRGRTGLDWVQTFNMSWTAGSVLLVDADGDGLDDVLIGVAAQAGPNPGLFNDDYEIPKQCCLSPGNLYQHGGQVIALHGFDGQKLWQTSTRSMVLYQNCLDIDVNSDGIVDCIVTGYNSTCQAIDIRTGETLWRINPELSPWSSHFVSGWDIYGAVSLPDFDLDGVLDLLVLHVINHDRLTTVEDTKSGRLVLLSGKTGTTIGQGYIEIPQGLYAPMSPIKYVTPQQELYLIYGSARENNVGTLMAISLPDLYNKVTGKELGGVDLSIYTWLHGINKNENGEAELFRDEGNGAVMAPVLVDMGQDQHIDLLVPSSGSVVLLDGKTLQERWRRNFVGLEIYKSVTPGYFDDDSVQDFMVHLKKEVCDGTNISQTFIINGADGEILWSYQVEHSAVSSIVSMETLTGKQSVFIVSLVGVNSSCGPLRLHTDIHMRADQEYIPNAETVQSYLSQLNDEELLKFCSDIGQSAAINHLSCANDFESLSETVLLLDKMINEEPLRLLQTKAFLYNFREQCATNDLHCYNLSATQNSKADLCVVMVPTYSTGAVADVDADGSLDYIHVSQLTGTLKRGDTFTIGSVQVSRHSVNSSISKGEFQQIKPVVDSVLHQPRSKSLQHVESWQFSHLKTLSHSSHFKRTICLSNSP